MYVFEFTGIGLSPIEPKTIPKLFADPTSTSKTHSPTQHEQLNSTLTTVAALQTLKSCGKASE